MRSHYRRMVDSNARQSVRTSDRTAGTVRKQLERAALKLENVEDDALAAEPDQLYNVVDAYHALKELDRLLPSVLGWCCLAVNQPATERNHEWISIFSAHRRKGDALKWLEWWREDPDIGKRDWELRYMPARVNVFVKQGGPPEDPGRP